jgi:hypothetical protein
MHQNELHMPTCCTVHAALFVRVDGNIGWEEGEDIQRCSKHVLRRYARKARGLP